MTTPLERELMSEAWVALTDKASAELEPLRLTGDTGALSSRLATEATATACIAVALAAAGALQELRTGSATTLDLDRGHVAAAVRSERYYRTGTRSTGMGFAPLSRFWRATDGWVRTHANYPWHRDALLRTLGLRDDSDHEVVGAAISERTARDIEESVFAAGGIAAAVRSVDDWRAHAQGSAVHLEPLVSVRSEPDAAPRSPTDSGGPMSGLRVLDFTRVIAGPVCTRYLGALGAEVMRLDPPHRPDMTAGAAADTLLGKRSAIVDMSTPAGNRALHDLLEHADVVVCGYRPGALDRFDLSDDVLIERYPGLVIVDLSAWGHTGPWAARRGFDSVVQAPTGIAASESADGQTPGTLPCQLLDHGTGYLAAAAVLDGVRRQMLTGGTHVRRLSLARTAAWLTARPPAEPPRPDSVDADPRPWLQVLDMADERIVAVRPPGRVADRELRWPELVTVYGADAPKWDKA
jgi:CoA-transferase family III